MHNGKGPGQVTDDGEYIPKQKQETAHSADPEGFLVPPLKRNMNKGGKKFKQMKRSISFKL